jgi:hypothetical protein
MQNNKTKLVVEFISNVRTRAIELETNAFKNQLYTLEHLSKLSWHQLRRLPKPNYMSPREWAQHLDKLEDYRSKNKQDELYEELPDDFLDVLDKKLEELKEHNAQLEQNAAMGGSRTADTLRDDTDFSRRLTRKNINLVFLGDNLKLEPSFYKLFDLSFEEALLDDLF